MALRPLILITNDDGIQATGIKHLWDAVRDFADVAIVAPLIERSGCGLGITWTKPLNIREYSWEDAIPAWSVNGTPADCVKMAISVLLKKRPDLIISGVNRGSNAGRTVLYSGTVGGVIEGVLRNIPGIAFSFSDNDFPTVGAVKEPIQILIQHFLKHSLPHGSFINANFPLNCEKGIQGIRMASQGRGYFLENPDRRLHPEGSPYYWLGGIWSKQEEDPNSDVALLEQGYLTAVPIHVGDLTDRGFLQKHKDAFESLVIERS
jgi:5'-nucleotidase